MSLLVALKNIAVFLILFLMTILLMLPGAPVMLYHIVTADNPKDPAIYAKLLKNWATLPGLKMHAYLCKFIGTSPTW